MVDLLRKISQDIFPELYDLLYPFFTIDDRIHLSIPPAKLKACDDLYVGPSTTVLDVNTCSIQMMFTPTKVITYTLTRSPNYYNTVYTLTGILSNFLVVDGVVYAQENVLFFHMTEVFFFM